MTFKNSVKNLTATADRFKHFWESKRFSFSDNTNIQMWMGFVNYFSDSTKVKVYKLASKRYRKEALRRKNT
ncbi:hypothetical protein [Emticicia sp. SJ17W-69]|uniref:hypothetical protein n=1 Tax=Emticicia sp. SJ17W-69 TaxID=3421657 RepID=UPI003EBD53EE